MQFTSPRWTSASNFLQSLFARTALPPVRSMKLLGGEAHTTKRKLRKLTSRTCLGPHNGGKSGHGKGDGDGRENAHETGMGMAMAVGMELGIDMEMGWGWE